MLHGESIYSLTTFNIYSGKAIIMSDTHTDSQTIRNAIQQPQSRQLYFNYILENKIIKPGRKPTRYNHFMGDHDHFMEAA